MTGVAVAGDYSAPAGTRIGHVHLRVADLDRAIAFYEGVLGFRTQARIGNRAAFLGAPLAGDAGTVYHHHIGLNTWDSRDGTPPPRGHTGLYHAAILYPSRADLAEAVRRVVGAGVRLTGATDHGISEAVYLDDPDGNGLELYRDRPPVEWSRDATGRLIMALRPLDVRALLALEPDRTGVSDADAFVTPPTPSGGPIEQRPLQEHRLQRPPRRADGGHAGRSSPGPAKAIVSAV